MRKASLGVVVGITLMTLGTIAHAGATGGQTANWVPQTVNFTYIGFTSNYSCNGLQHLLRKSLIALGARQKNLTLNAYNCGIDTDQPTRTPRVKLGFDTLQPMTGTGGGVEKAVATHWAKVDVGAVADYESGDCELVEQIKRQVLPKFTTRNVKVSADCVPNQSFTGRPGLRLDVLKPDQSKQP